ncbi:MAG: alpha/beta hydrolase [Dehalococcoidia bacterium]|nr:alpha/beta hydrolase [Dehalococcoidia bacterium]
MIATPELVQVPGDDTEPLDERLDAGIPCYLVQTARGGMAYRAVGDPSDPVVVLTHAVPLSSLAWVSVLPHLAAQGLRVYAVDMPGTGGTPPAPTPLSVEGYADYLRAFLDAMDLPRVLLVGHASHAAAALSVAATTPDRVEKLVLSKLPYVDEEGRKRMGAAKADWYRPDGSPAMRRDMPWRPRPDVTDQRFAVMLRRMNFDMYRAGPRSAEGHHALERYDFLADLARLTMPTRFVWGERDHFVEHQELVVGAAQQVNPDLRIVVGASAWPMYERPRGWARAVGSGFTQQAPLVG